MMWAALSEWHGRRFIYIGSTVIYVASTVGCAMSKNIGVFVVVRILQSIGASAAQAVGAGTISDLFTMQERGSAMGLFLLGPLIGPVVGPIAGGYINECKCPFTVRCIVCVYVLFMLFIYSFL